jgi:Ran GTPase-activating protein (RanGAP) involved in mRNA processing and transport
MRALVSHIATLPLRSLDLGGNLLREEGAAALATGLHRLNALTALDVSCNFMSDSGIPAVAMHVGRLPSLCHLDFRMNMIVLAIPVLMQQAASTLS